MAEQEEIVGLGYADPGLGQAMAEAVKQEVAKVRRGVLHRTYCLVLQALGEVQGDEPVTFLDVGCGVGLYRAVLEHAGREVIYTGVDINDVLVREARILFPSVSFDQMDARKLEFDDQSFDVVMGGALLEHIQEWGDVLAEMCRVAKSYLILHRTLLVSKGHTLCRVESAFGVPVWRVYLASQQLRRVLKKHGCRVVRRWQVCDVGELGRHVTLLCERV